MVKQRIKKFLAHPCKIKRNVKKVANQTTIKPQISETSVNEFNQANFLGTNFVEVKKVV
jgi:O-succinylbenzoate synthase